MRLTVHQELALASPYTEADAKRLRDIGANTEHMMCRWISTDVQVHVIFTVSVPNEGAPFWHVSMGIAIRNVGKMLTAGLDRPMRRRLREIGEEILKGVGYPPDHDKWEIGEKALHVTRQLTDLEVKHMQELQRARD